MAGEELWQRFEDLAGEAFRAVIEKYALRKVSSGFQAPDGYLVFVNATSGLAINYALSQGPWVQIGPLHKLWDLRFYLQERAPAEASRSFTAPVGDPRLSDELAELARLTDTYTADVLRGDFRILPNVLRRAEENLRRSELELYGKVLPRPTPPQPPTVTTQSLILRLGAILNVVFLTTVIVFAMQPLGQAALLEAFGTLRGHVVVPSLVAVISCVYMLLNLPAVLAVMLLMRGLDAAIPWTAFARASTYLLLTIAASSLQWFLIARWYAGRSKA